MEKKLLFVLMVLFGDFKSSTVFSLPHFVSNFSYWFKILNPCFVNAWKLSMIKFGTHLMKLFCGLQSHIVFIRYPFGRNISNCKIRFKIKCVRDNNMPTVLSTSQILYIPSFPMIVLTFETFALLVTYTATCRSDSAEFLMVSESAIRMFFYLQTA